jgi:hypothetical protein
MIYRESEQQSAALLNRLRIIIPVFALVIVIGTVGYWLLEDDYG